MPGYQELQLPANISWSLASIAAAGSVGGLFFLRYLLDRVLFQRLALWCLLEPGGYKKGSIPGKKLHDVHKFCESCWKLFAYCILFGLGISALYNQPWIWHPAQYWEAWPSFAPTVEMSTYYAAELTFYLGSTFMLAFWEERRHDFHIMMLHHVVSVFLISSSYLCSITRAGTVVMALHDPSDIFLEGAKICDYAGWELPATGLFFLLLATWGFLRLIVLPVWIIPSIMVELPIVLGGHQDWSLVMTSMLCLLVVLHAYWFYLIVKIAIDFVRTGEKRDVRERKD